MFNSPTIFLAMITGSIIVLFALYSHTYFNERKPYLQFWLLGWGIYLLVYLVRFGELGYQHNEFLLIADQVLYVLANYLIFRGFFRYMGKPLPEFLNYAVESLLIVILMGIYFQVPWIMQKVPNILSVTGLYIWGGIQLIRFRTNSKWLNHIVGWTLIGWGLTICSFLFLETSTEILVGQVICSGLALMVALGSLQCHIQSVRRQLSEPAETWDYFGMCDVLTGLYSRNFFEHCINELNQDINLPLSIIIGDMNGLKLVNDTFGHHQGDILLKEMAETLRKACRSTDLIVRWGGDEFVVILLKTDTATAEQIAGRIKEACARIESTPIPLSISLGVATLTKRATEIEQVFKEAEDLMYSNKLIEGKVARKKIINSLERLLAEKDYESRAHVERVQDLALNLGTRLGLTNNEMNNLATIAALHDIGKIAIPEKIVHKTAALTLEEWEIMKRHTEIGYRFAQSVGEISSIAEGILGHHEWWNGKGYPQGLKGDEIPLLARIIAIADAFDVMVHGRHYKSPYSNEDALQEVKQYAGTQFDPWLVDIFVKAFKSSIKSIS